jgi:hypothetical protein
MEMVFGEERRSKVVLRRLTFSGMTWIPRRLDRVATLFSGNVMNCFLVEQFDFFIAPPEATGSRKLTMPSLALLTKFEHGLIDLAFPLDEQVNDAASLLTAFTLTRDGPLPKTSPGLRGLVSELHFTDTAGNCLDLHGN